MGELIPYFKDGGRIYPDNSDLNSITSYGIYSGANLKAMTNCPSDAPSLLFTLIVHGYDGYKRLVQTAISANGYIRSRTYTNTIEGEKWTEWG